MDKTIRVFLHDVPAEPVEINVNLCDSVRRLDDFVCEKGTRVFFYNGRIIVPAFSFSFFDIKDGDHIFVVRPQHNNHRMNTQSAKCSHVSKDQILRKLQAKLAASLITEAARLSDISRNQCEGMMMAEHLLNARNERKHTEMEGFKTVFAKSPMFPSSEALPPLC